MDARNVVTLADILPAEGPMKMLIVAKTPAVVSVDEGAAARALVMPAVP